jgi:hypothetical protein
VVARSRSNSRKATTVRCEEFRRAPGGALKETALRSRGNPKQHSDGAVFDTYVMVFVSPAREKRAKRGPLPLSLAICIVSCQKFRFWIMLSVAVLWSASAWCTAL